MFGFQRENFLLSTYTMVVIATLDSAMSSMVWLMPQVKRSMSKS